MIILKHLTIERFRLLRAMDLHFPQRGSILVQGPNESGKSALIESIYFALYGEQLASQRGKRSLDDLILYGAATANVTLTLSVGASELIISRTIERGKGQSVHLQVRHLGMPDEEPVTDVTAANAQIIAELGRMNGEALRNACLIEQKGLNRLETISGTEREATIRKILGLEKLAELTEQFSITPEDERMLEECSEHLQLAEIQARIPQLSEQLESVETALDAVKVNECLADIEQQETEINEQEQTLEQIQTKRLDLKSRQGRVQQLKKADATLTEIITSYEDIAEARRELPELERQVAELERREYDELPVLEKRVDELAELTRSFGTLQRMSNDLLTTVDSIKEQEQEARQYNELKQEIALLNEQISHVRSRLTQSQQSWQELEDQRRLMRPQLDARLERLNTLAERLAFLGQVETQYTQRLASRTLAEENATQLKKVQRELNDTEQELSLVENEARYVQREADDLEKTWRQISIRRQLETWQHQKGLAEGLAQAEQHVNQARQHQSKLTHDTIEAREAARKYIVYIGAYGVGALLCLVIAIISLQQAAWLSIVLFILMLGAIGMVLYNFQTYRKASAAEKSAHQLEQASLSRVGMMVAAREAAARMIGDTNALMRIENEIRSLGGSVPASSEEARQLLEQWQDQGDLGDIQQRMKEKLDAANAAHNQVNVTMEAVATLRKEWSRLNELRKQEHWDQIEENLQSDQAAVERMQQEITLLAGQEGLPIPSINARLQASPIVASESYASGPIIPVTEEEVAGVPELGVLIDSTIKATEHEIASLEGKLDIANEHAAQMKVHQQTLDSLLVRLNVLNERNAQYQDDNPDLALERGREQQVALRSALQSLQDSLRQRVKLLGVAFGQTAVSGAEAAARKQLEDLQITLGNKVMFQERQTHYGNVLKDRQLALAELYKQLAKFSNTLGSWIVPLNPFAEALVGLRQRSQQELEDANEKGIVEELSLLEQQEGASRARIELCRQEITQLQESIAVLLAQRKRSQPKSYAPSDITVVWPLLSEYTLADRERLNEQRITVERELDQLELQEMERSGRLGTGTTPLDLEQARARMEQQERSYQTKKRGNQIVKEVDLRLLRKMVPRTEYYMEQILPALTGGRYHDVHLITEPEEGTIGGGALQIQVWDAAAGEYLHSSALSSGAADVLSLALRLAFAIATLPRELSAAPGFILLDEPLSSFDRGRTQALVNVVTGELLSQHYEQIMLISHSGAFDPAMFPYHLYMDNGLLVESNFPVVPTLLLTAREADEEEEEKEPATVGAVTSNGESA